MVKAKRLFDIDRTFPFDAEIAVTRHGKAVFQWLGQPAVKSFQKSSLGSLPHNFIVLNKQTPWRIDTEEGHGVETLLTQLGRQNAVIREGVAIDFARELVWQSPLQSLLI